MKTDINTTLNKLLSYAFDNLLLDPLDESYTLNRLATACKCLTPARDESIDYGTATIDDLLKELKAAAPDADIAAVNAALFPMPRTVSVYFTDALARSKEKAFDKLYELYAHGYKTVSASPAAGKNGFLCYYDDTENPVCGAALADCGELGYTPRVMSNRIAQLENPDEALADIMLRFAEYVNSYGGTIALNKFGTGEPYTVCASTALDTAKVKTVLSDGIVKIALLDYPVPALALSGIAKNRVASETARILKAATEAGINHTAAATVKDGVLTYFVIFANDIAPSEFFAGSDALTACGVFRTIDCSPLLSVLEKGTALSTDLAPFKPIYDKIGGVKYGDKATAELGGALVDIILPMFKASAATDEATAVSFVSTTAE